jgi:hypothetical protein
MRERITRSRDSPTAGPGPAIASRVSNSQPPLALAWHCSDAVTRRRAIAFTRQTSRRWRLRDRFVCSLRLAPRRHEITFGRQSNRVFRGGRMTKIVPGQRRQTLNPSVGRVDSGQVGNPQPAGQRVSIARRFRDRASPLRWSRLGFGRDPLSAPGGHAQEPPNNARRWVGVSARPRPHAMPHAGGPANAMVCASDAGDSFSV